MVITIYPNPMDFDIRERIMNTLRGLKGREFTQAKFETPNGIDFFPTKFGYKRISFSIIGNGNDYFKVDIEAEGFSSSYKIWFNDTGVQVALAWLIEMIK